MSPTSSAKSWGDGHASARSPRASLAIVRDDGVKRSLDVVGSPFGLLLLCRCSCRCDRHQARLAARFSSVSSGSDKAAARSPWSNFAPWWRHGARGTALTVRADRKITRVGRFLGQASSTSSSARQCPGRRHVPRRTPARGSGIHAILLAGSTRDHRIDAAGIHRLRSDPVSRRKFVARSKRDPIESIGVTSCRSSSGTTNGTAMKSG